MIIMGHKPGAHNSQASAAQNVKSRGVVSFGKPKRKGPLTAPYPVRLDPVIALEAPSTSSMSCNEVDWVFAASWWQNVSFSAGVPSSVRGQATRTNKCPPQYCSQAQSKREVMGL